MELCVPSVNVRAHKFKKKKDMGICHENWNWYNCLKILEEKIPWRGALKEMVTYLNEV